MENIDLEVLTKVLSDYFNLTKTNKSKSLQNRCFYRFHHKYLVLWSWVVFSFLSCVIFLTASLLALKDNSEFPSIWHSVLAGVLGSSCSALMSALERRANGWEDKFGNKYPDDVPKDKFNLGMISFFLFRPVFGIFAGVLIYFGFQTKYFHNISFEYTDVVFWSLLCGLFVKTLIDKMKNLFESLIGSK